MAAHGGGVRLPKVLRLGVDAGKKGGDSLEQLGQQGAFYARSAVGAPRVVGRYRKEVMRLLAEVAFGSGALAVIGGTVVIVVFMTFFTGLEVGQQGYNSLNSLGAAVYTGFVSAYFNTREIAPIIAAIALSATVGCGFTAQLGAMRVSEEIDALETLAVPSVPYLVTTRLIAGFVAVVPLYVLGLLASYASTQLITTQLFGQSSGTYSHYFRQFLPHSDIFISFAKVLVFAVIIILTHCYYGYTASGGPAGVGVAVGRAVRLAITSVVAVDLLLDLALYGTNVSVRIAG
ncbi:MAG: phospholipid/cholesterol/gamma-HCH transport system permease protein [Actinomycetota bacterium]|jgi:phospholipid/cholesterol/gamma-HCH transport system permease protein|nr:phospholipid/cholesterol/gamma-HCH transport system permease protein [Actinomycetota bacterium]MDT7549289.1 phospholipid/cholesterol/gamma-HCH transport system permease protein [Actinomycetota bacterium]